MQDIYSPKYDKLRNWVKDALKRNYTWDQIRFLNRSSEDELEQALKSKIIEDFWPEDTSVELWYKVVAGMEKAEKEREELELRHGKTILKNKLEDTEVTVPEDENSSWMLYKKKLRESNFKEESIEQIESTTIQILKRLTSGGMKPVKGMVMGQVQSGKTANIAALMAMAADWGWNMFIVLSGTVENLRKQTQDRLYRDLKHEGCNIHWDSINYPSLHSEQGRRAQDLDFSSSSKFRYFTVCIKHPKRLEDLIKWMQADYKKYQQMKVIVIDDEADQGGINTAKISKAERSRINKLIVNLVEGKNYEGKQIPAGPLAMNYIGYTATPYANFLNESHPESLYPSNFIQTLTPSKEYFGPEQIFGIEGTERDEGLDIIRIVDNESLEKVKLLQDRKSKEFPEPLKDSIAWFLCASSALRVMDHKKPISMLVHTSQKQIHHQAVADAISDWIKFARDNGELIQRCKEIWKQETKRFTPEVFRRQFPEYPESNKITDYPRFKDIEKEIINIASEISHIPMNEDKQPKYHKGIHLCIDNCANNGITDENMYVRLVYPDPKNCPTPPPVFIVVGGSTLSRGLTIEGLVSTFFLRTSRQADSLMQMGRWFGYRHGYELYPRIWMTEKTKEKFRFLALLEHELRDDLKRFAVVGADPSVYGPRVRSTPKALELKLTSANKMQDAIAAEMDFSGTNVQTVVFPTAENDLLHNINVTDSFLNTLGDGTLSAYTGHSVVWRDVPFELIKEKLIQPFIFHERARVFNQMDLFCEWYEKAAEEAGYTNWNIVAAGIEVKNHDKIWKLPGGNIGKIERSLRGERKDDSVSIGVLRAPKDLYEDIEAGFFSDNEFKEISKNASNEKVREAREKAGLENTPLLILYRIDKDSKDLNVPVDIIGMSVWVPGVKSKSLIKYLTVRINNEEFDDDNEAGGLDED